MKRTAYLFCLVLVFIIFYSTNLWCGTTDGWELQYPTPQTNSLHDICVIPGTEKVITVGNNGTVMISNDKGEHWNIIEDSNLDGHNLSAIDFVDSETGYVTSLDGQIFKTTDQGLSWSRKKSGVAESLSAIDFYDTSFGVAVGTKGTVVRTVNSGSSWEVLESGTEEDLRAVCCINRDTVFVTGGHGDYVDTYSQDPEEEIVGVIYRTFDGGNNWSEVATGLADNYYCIDHNSDGTLVFGAGYNYSSPFVGSVKGYLFKTDDFGETFERSSVPFIPCDVDYTGSCYWRAIGYYHYQELGMNNSGPIRKHSKIYKSIDNGCNWSHETSISDKTYAQVEIDSLHNIAVGKHGTIVRTEDKWLSIDNNFIATDAIYQVDFTPDSSGYFLTDQSLFKMADADGSWKKIFGLDPYGNVNSLTFIEFLNDSTGFVIGEPRGCVNASVVLKTEDEGNTWENIHDTGGEVIISAEMPCVFKLGFHNTNNGYVTGGEYFGEDFTDLMFQTRDGGNSWEQVELEHKVGDFFCENEQVAFLCGKDGLLMKTDDGGDSWVELGNLDSGNFTKVRFMGITGILLDDNGTCLYSNDGGQTWEQSVVSQKFISVQILDNNTVYAVNLAGNIYISPNGGKQWCLQDKGVAHRINSISLQNENTLYAVGNGGVILKNKIGIAGYNQSVLDYYPLQTGNKWIYEESDFNGITGYHSVEVTGDTLMTNGKQYYIMNRAGDFTYERVDSLSANVYRFNTEGEETLIDSLKALTGDGSSANRYGWDDFFEDGFVSGCHSINEGVHVLGQMTSEKDIWRYYIPNDMSHKYYKLAKGLGLSEFHEHDEDGAGIYQKHDELVYANINGKEYGSLHVQGQITQHATWNIDTVKVTGDIIIEDGVILDIEKGTTVQFQGAYKFDVKGRLNAIGSAGNRITFEKKEGGEDWRGITFMADPAVIDTSVLKFCVIRDIDDPLNGGGIVVKEGNKVIISDCIIEDADSEFNGGGISVTNADVSIINCLLINNHTAGNGGAIAIDNSNISMLNTTIADNNADVNGGGVYIKDCEPQISNSIIYSNKAENIGDQVYVEGSEEIPGFFYCNIEEGLEGLGSSDNIDFTGNWLDNIDQDPQFCPDSVEVKGYKSCYTLSENSPCINKGSTDTSGLNIPVNDLGGYNRIVQERIDIGSYECRTPNGIEYEELIATEFILYQNYPNPFNPSTTIKYSVPEGFAGMVKLNIYNCMGQVVKQMENRVNKAGIVKLHFNASSLPSGLYYYGIKAGEKVMFKKMVLLK